MPFFLRFSLFFVLLLRSYPGTKLSLSLSPAHLPPKRSGRNGPKREEGGRGKSPEEKEKRMVSPAATFKRRSFALNLSLFFSVPRINIAKGEKKFCSFFHDGASSADVASFFRRGFPSGFKFLKNRILVCLLLESCTEWQYVLVSSEKVLF